MRSIPPGISDLGWRHTYLVQATFTAAVVPLLASLFLRIWLFELYSTTFESFFFDRAFPGWFTILMAVFGLRYAARLRVAP